LLIHLIGIYYNSVIIHTVTLTAEAHINAIGVAVSVIAIAPIAAPHDAIVMRIAAARLLN
jgi:hypothetical protein